MNEQAMKELKAMKRNFIIQATAIILAGAALITFALVAYSNDIKNGINYDEPKGFEFVELTDGTVLHIESYSTTDCGYKAITTDGNIYEFENCDIVASK